MGQQGTGLRHVCRGTGLSPGSGENSLITRGQAPAASGAAETGPIYRQVREKQPRGSFPVPTPNSEL